MKNSLTGFGRNVKIRLLDLGQTQNWLIEQAQQRTDKYIDTSNIYKIMTGQLNSPEIVRAICEVLDISYPQDHSTTADVR